MLTPSRKKLGKAVARKSKQKIARECLKDRATKQYTLKEVNKLIQTEIHSVCSFEANSIMKSQSVEVLKEFEWSKILHELAERAPTFLAILRGVTKTRKPRNNTNAVICICAAILLKHRFGKMSLVQRVISLLLYSGHVSKQVCALFCVHEFSFSSHSIYRCTHIFSA